MDAKNIIGKVTEWLQGSNPADIEIYLRLFGEDGQKSFRLDAFSTEIIADVDQKGQPSHTKKGGLLVCTMSGEVSTTLLDAMLNRYAVEYDGLIEFRHETLFKEVPCVISFCAARCITYERVATPYGRTTRIILSPESIQIDVGSQVIKQKNRPEWH